MTRVFVDITEVETLNVRAEVEFAAFPRAVLDIATSAIAEEQAEHEYQNRSHDLENSTYAVPITETDSTVEIEFGARMPYASYLETRGLSRVTELWEKAETEFEFFVDGMSESIVGG